jgi:hypothetical protein
VESLRDEGWRLWPAGSRGSTKTARTGDMKGPRTDAITVATLTTSSPVAPKW